MLSISAVTISIASSFGRTVCFLLGALRSISVVLLRHFNRACVGWHPSSVRHFYRLFDADVVFGWRHDLVVFIRVGGHVFRSLVVSFWLVRVVVVFVGNYSELLGSLLWRLLVRLLSAHDIWILLWRLWLVQEGCLLVCVRLGGIIVTEKVSVKAIGVSAWIRIPVGVRVPRLLLVAGDDALAVAWLLECGAISDWLLYIKLVVPLVQVWRNGLSFNRAFYPCSSFNSFSSLIWVLVTMVVSVTIIIVSRLSPWIKVILVLPGRVSGLNRLKTFNRFLDEVCLEFRWQRLLKLDVFFPFSEPLFDFFDHWLELLKRLIKVCRDTPAVKSWSGCSSLNLFSLICLLSSYYTFRRLWELTAIKVESLWHNIESLRNNVILKSGKSRILTGSCPLGNLIICALK